ncbi:WD40 repeat domain-containing protein [Saccharopolyspora shandongensis]|uniref:WD40 repeat domain-containing protein n=1 Tax=Saccharopolyspora shandongensis TaxID=418495 RepID=UPI0033F60244
MRLWHTDGGNRAVLTGHRSAIANVEISQDGQWLATSSNDGVLRVRAQDGTECSVHNSPIAGVAIESDGDRITTIGAADRPQGGRVHHGLAHRFRAGDSSGSGVPEQNRKHPVSRPREACSTRRRPDGTSPNGPPEGNATDAQVQAPGPDHHRRLHVGPER